MLRFVIGLLMCFLLQANLILRIVASYVLYTKLHGKIIVDIIT